ncbi:MAG: hypothetical protein JWQ11_4275 [Rhizobacter sp.]|nr:hypothetical protein [Rhizobacter sp.]
MRARVPAQAASTPLAPPVRIDARDATRPLRRVGLCVDDFGMHDGVNAAVFRLASVSRLSAFGCLVDAPAFRDGALAIAAAELQHSGIAVGLHLDLTEGYTDMSRSLRSLIVASYLHGLSGAALRREIDRQLDVFEREIGTSPDFVDGHQHVHQLPQVRDALLAALLKRYPDRLPWLRSTRRPARLADARFKAGVIETLGSKALTRRARKAGFAQNAHLLGVYDFDDADGGYPALTKRWLEASVDGDLLMCHPSAHTTALDPLLPVRLREYQWLTGPGFAQALADTGVTLGLR